jgi:kinesin family protein 5
VLKNLETAPGGGDKEGIAAETRDLIRTHLAQNQDLVRDLQERLRLSHEEAEVQVKRRAEVEITLGKINAAYEELLGEFTNGVAGNTFTLMMRRENEFEPKRGD